YPNHDPASASSCSPNGRKPSPGPQTAGRPAVGFGPPIDPSITGRSKLRRPAVSSSGRTPARVSGVWVSGTISLETTIEARIATTDAAKRCPAICGNTPVINATYTPRVLDATVAIPVVKTTNNSERVILSR